MLIGIDASRATAPQRTGTENYSLFLIHALLQLDSANRYRLYFNQPPEPGLFPAAANIEMRTMSFPRLWTHVRLSWEMALHPPDVLFVPAHVLPLVRPRRCVVTVHDLGYLHYPQAHTRWAGWYLRWSTAHNARVAAHLIADSKATKRDLIKHAHTAADKISVIYPGYDPSFAPVHDTALLAAVRARYQLPESFALYVGTLQPRKNLVRLLEAFAVLVQQRREVHLAIAGKKGWLYEGLFAQVEQLGLQQQVRFLGYVPQEDLPALLSAAQLFVLPSLYEGFGLPVLEAMACGVPVICSNVSSLPEVAGNAAILVNPLDTTELVQRLGLLLDDGHLRQDMSQRGLRQVQRFSWEKCAREILQLLEAVGRGP
ncbi:MAG: glycosyltransferase family 4 protein [Chloroflexi bacterium]|nr:glycosyltransferase family 4 protein [Chloroflexota bacterium]